MCGIVGAVNGHSTAKQLVKGLARLEYRGYDSSGIAVLHDQKIDHVKAVGKLGNLVDRLNRSPIDGAVGIAHTRWATHGSPNEVNAHPHVYGDVAVVHNGIIENFRELRAEMEAGGHVFESDTDSEVLPHLLDAYLAAGKSLEAALESTLSRISGSYAIAALVKGEDERLVAARRGSPLAIGHGEDAMFVASDALALAPMTNRITYLEEGDWAIIDKSGVELRDSDGRPRNRRTVVSNLGANSAEKNGFRHYMLKEIYEQPEVVRRTFAAHENEHSGVPEFPFNWADLPRLGIVACGTSSYAASIAKYWFEEHAGIPVDVDIASEYRYRASPVPQGGAVLLVSQSGETADTLAALRYAKARGQQVISLVNVPESTMARESDAVIPTYAGPEIGVASTKAFTAQLTALACLVVDAARVRGMSDSDQLDRIVNSIQSTPMLIENVLKNTKPIEAAANAIVSAKNAMFMGRGVSFPLAMEGALKLKEISYIHAEGFGAGELKHGPIALIDEKMPAIVIAPTDSYFDKTISNLQEVKARGAQVIVLTDEEGAAAVESDADHLVVLPKTDPFVVPIVYVVALQLLAYHVAVGKGTDVDQPRNLAKSVTVE